MKNIYLKIIMIIFFATKLMATSEEELPTGWWSQATTLIHNLTCLAKNSITLSVHKFSNFLPSSSTTTFLPKRQKNLGKFNLSKLTLAIFCSGIPQAISWESITCSSPVPDPLPDHSWSMTNTVCSNLFLVNGWVDDKEYKFGDPGIPSVSEIKAWQDASQNFFYAEAYPSLGNNLTIVRTVAELSIEKSLGVRLVQYDFHQWMQSWQVPVLKILDCGQGDQQPDPLFPDYKERIITGNIALEIAYKTTYACKSAHNIWISAFTFIKKDTQGKDVISAAAESFPRFRFATITSFRDAKNPQDNWKTVSHEMAHLHGALDERKGSICEDTGGINYIPNGNSHSCTRTYNNPFPCLMDPDDNIDHRHLCRFTRGQLGWGYWSPSKSLPCWTNFGMALTFHKVDAEAYPRLFMSHISEDEEVYIGRSEQIPDIMNMNCGLSKVGYKSVNVPTLASIKTPENRNGLYLFFVEREDRRIRYVISYNGGDSWQSASDLSYSFNTQKFPIFIPDSNAAIAVSRLGKIFAFVGYINNPLDQCGPGSVNLCLANIIFDGGTGKINLATAYLAPVSIPSNNYRKLIGIAQRGNYEGYDYIGIRRVTYPYPINENQLIIYEKTAGQRIRESFKKDQYNPRPEGGIGAIMTDHFINDLGVGEYYLYVAFTGGTGAETLKIASSNGLPEPAFPYYQTTDWFYNVSVKDSTSHFLGLASVTTTINRDEDYYRLCEVYQMPYDKRTYLRCSLGYF